MPAFYVGASFLGVSAFTSFESSSTIFMIVMITCLSIVKDFLFSSMQDEGPTRFFVAFPKSRNTTTVGLLMTCLIGLALVILHSKGALARVVDSVSATDFVATYKIVTTTVGSAITEVIQREILPADPRAIVYRYGEGTMSKGNEGGLFRREYIAFCGNEANPASSISSSSSSSLTAMYIEFNEAGELVLSSGTLSMSEVSFPSKYFYYVLTAIFPRPLKSTSDTDKIILKETITASSVRFSFEPSSSQLKIYTVHGEFASLWRIFFVKGVLDASMCRA